MTPPPSFWQRPLVLGSLSALLLCGGWPPYPSAAPALLLFIGWVPYLLMERQLTLAGARKGRVFACTYWVLLVWNALTTWWVSYSSLPAGMAAVVLNALMMCLPLMAFRQTKKRFGNRLGYLSLPIYWIAFEQLHLHWDLTWPWLTLGNGFAAAPQWVQWYEYTGFLGGSVWVWAVNLLVFSILIKNYKLKSKSATTSPTGVYVDGSEVKPAFLIFNSQFLIPLLAIVLPIGLSYLIGASYQEKGPTTEVVVVQPNLDPYEEKFLGGARFVPYDEQLTRMLALSAQHLTPATRLIIWPETALEEPYWENTIESNPKILRIKAWLAGHPGVALLTGITTLGSYPSKEAASETARYRDDLGYYDFFNSGAYFASASAPVAFYHKSRLVPGVEKIPPLLTALVSHIDLGGTVGSVGSQPERTVYPAPANAPALRVAPIICYESIYGDFVSEYVPNGATLLAVFTNDAWWLDSPGYRQLLRYGSLRCIETRRDLARAANTGFTGFINQKGEIYQQVPAWIATASRGTVHLNSEVTFYARFGELIGRAAQLLAVLGIVAVVAWTLRVRALNR
ncbi:apolipoprotein N-acyltransferase [Hymenobacter sp. H14-R3]|uniref:apolipoprotein N-acyltransferase n=1 Tax=Hymenobacter sp. H14-R3 TaxID=3046308 RepID=UPI0024B92D34|nr:apolipoprotein N-acyltransferase [Hymenobacter sp. H14-R3]MDJ0367553.1 apolipoprotein N-acyltransferase [Hymenobacter sp. H14-R3]